jgi:NAD(P)H-hydrate epimerase
MVFFSSHEPSFGRLAEEIKSKLLSFIWAPWEEIGDYIEKSDAVLIGPGFMRFRSERVPHGERHHVCDETCQLTRNITEQTLKQFPEKRWVIDAGSLQVMEADWIPKGAILTPNQKEFKLLFPKISPAAAAKKYQCTIALKGPQTQVCSPTGCVKVTNGNAGLTKGGTGDVQAGLSVAFYAKNEAFLAAAAASYIIKATADILYQKKGIYYHADDLAEKAPEVLFSLTK